MIDPNKQYLDDMVINLRLRCVPGDEIGAFLEEARAHLEASGETAEEAFGPVEEYARDLAISKGRRATPQGWSRREFVIATVHFVAWFFLAQGVIAWVFGDPAEIRVGMIVGFLLGLLLAARVVWPAVVAYATRRQPLGIMLAATLGSVAIVALVVGFGGRYLWSDPVLWSVPAPVLTGGALGVLVISMIPLIRRPDPIQRPV